MECYIAAVCDTLGGGVKPDGSAVDAKVCHLSNVEHSCLAAACASCGDRLIWDGGNVGASHYQIVLKVQPLCFIEYTSGDAFF